MAHFLVKSSCAGATWNRLKACDTTTKKERKKKDAKKPKATISLKCDKLFRMLIVCFLFKCKNRLDFIFGHKMNANLMLFFVAKKLFTLHWNWCQRKPPFHHYCYRFTSFVYCMAINKKASTFMTVGMCLIENGRAISLVKCWTLLWTDMTLLWLP